MVDAVVIGSGSSGLVFANLLADAGWSVTGGRHIFTPKSFEAHNSNLDHGAVAGGTAHLHQQLIFRPTPGLGRPGTPVQGPARSEAKAEVVARAAIMQDRIRRARSVIPFGRLAARPGAPGL